MLQFMLQLCEKLWTEPAGFGIFTQNQFMESGEQRRFPGSRVSCTVLNIGENPTRAQIQIFEDIGLTLCMSNGAHCTMFRNRFRDVGPTAIGILERLYSSDTELLVEDRAVPNGLTSMEWAQQLFLLCQAFPNSKFEGSKGLLYLIQLSLATGEKYILEPEGQPLQYIKPPFVVSLSHKKSLPFLINRLIAAQARRRLRHLSLHRGWKESLEESGHQGSKLNCVHPEELSLSRTNPQFQLRTRSAFEVTLNVVHVLRTMNILNRDYFSELQLRVGSKVAFQSLKLDGVWIVSRPMEEDFSSLVTLLRKHKNGGGVLARIGNGSEMEAYAGQVQPGSCFLADQ
jgi:hypothetical protein